MERKKRSDPDLRCHVVLSSLICQRSNSNNLETDAAHQTPPLFTGRLKKWACNVQVEWHVNRAAAAQSHWGGCARAGQMHRLTAALVSLLTCAPLTPCNSAEASAHQDQRTKSSAMEHTAQQNYWLCRPHSRWGLPPQEYKDLNSGLPRLKALTTTLRW